LRGCKDADLTPSKLVELNLKNIYESKSVDTTTKRQHTDWLLEFINRESRDKDGNWVRSGKWIKGIVTAVRTFYEANDSPLFGKMRIPLPVLYRKRSKTMSIEQARRLIAVLPFRAKVIAIIQMKSGMRISEVLHLKWSDLKERFQRKEAPLRVDLINDRGKDYFTFIDAEAIEYLRQYLVYREKLVGRQIQDDEYIFIAEYAGSEPRLKPLDRDSLVRQFYETAKSKGLVTNNDNGKRSHKTEFKSHGFRHVFKTEGTRAGAEMKIQRIDMIVEYFMGHDKGVQEIYDHNSEFHPELFTSAYEQLSPYLNLDASKIEESKIAAKARSDAAGELRRENEQLKDTVTLQEERIARLEGQYETILKDRYKSEA
jgi:integrase